MALIYLDPDNMAASNDPIPASTAFRRVASNEQELIDIIQLDQKDGETANKELYPRNAFCSRLYSTNQP